MGLFPSDAWGTLYTVDVDIDRLTAKIEILYDSDDKGHREAGIRSPDNLTWAQNGSIYVQEDHAIGLGLFGANGVEASIWELQPDTGIGKRIAMIDRNAVLPKDGHDRYAGRIGAWKLSGVTDVSRWFATRPGQTVLLASVQAHGIRDGRISGKRHLVESGQILLLKNHPDDQRSLSPPAPRASR
jgi:hypothetical protein